jgi:hypothetical protein
MAATGALSPDPGVSQRKQQTAAGRRKLQMCAGHAYGALKETHERRKT